MKNKNRQWMSFAVCTAVVGLFALIAYVGVRSPGRGERVAAQKPMLSDRMWTATVQSMTREEVESGVRVVLKTLGPDQNLEPRWERASDGLMRIRIVDSVTQQQKGLMLVNYTPLSFSLNDRWVVSQSGSPEKYKPDALRSIVEKRLDSLLPNGIDVLHMEWTVDRRPEGYGAQLTYTLGRNGSPFLDRLSSVSLLVDSEGNALRFVQGGPFEEVPSQEIEIDRQEAAVKIADAIGVLLKRNVTVDDVVVLSGWVEVSDGEFQFLHVGRQKSELGERGDTIGSLEEPQNRFKNWDWLRSWMDAEMSPAVFLVNGVTGEVSRKPIEPFPNSRLATELRLNWKWPD